MAPTDGAKWIVASDVPRRVENVNDFLSDFLSGPGKPGEGDEG
jgi:hypothetical protein